MKVVPTEGVCVVSPTVEGCFGGGSLSCVAGDDELEAEGGVRRWERDNWSLRAGGGIRKKMILLCFLLFVLLFFLKKKYLYLMEKRG